jgi:hypothetical protein
VADARCIWAQHKQTLYSVGNLLRCTYWAWATYVDGTVVSSGDTAVINGDLAGPLTWNAISRDEGGTRVYVNGANIFMNTSSAANDLAGIGCTLAPGGAGTRSNVIRLANSYLEINSTNASQNGTLACVRAPAGACAESGALATEFDLSGTTCVINAAGSSAALAGVLIPADADHVNWTTRWTGGRISLSGGSTRRDVDNAETASGASVTLTGVERAGALNGAGKTYITETAPAAACSAKCTVGQSCTNTSPALCFCTAADTWTKVSGGGSCP